MWWTPETTDQWQIKYFFMSKLLYLCWFQCFISEELLIFSFSYDLNSYVLPSFICLYFSLFFIDKQNSL